MSIIDIPKYRDSDMLKEKPDVLASGFFFMSDT